MSKISLTEIEVERIKRVIIEIGSPIIPLTLIFESLGFSGVTGIGWGILAGAIAAVADELGYIIEKSGGQILLIKKERKKDRKP